MSELDDLGELSTRVRGAYGRVHEHHPTLGSTNDRAMQWLQQGAPHGAVVTTDTQTAGRGRRGRQWLSPPGQGLCVSLLLRPGPRPEASRFGALGLAVGVGLREGLPPLRHAVELKWPNDLLVQGRKLGGILCEARWVGDTPEVVVGFGLNVHPQSVPAPLREQATCVAEHVRGSPPGRAALLAELLLGLERAIEPFLREGFAAVRERYLPHCSVLGRTIEVGDAASPAGARRGVATRIDDRGALWVRPVGADGDASEAAAFMVDAADVWLAPGG